MRIVALYDCTCSFNWIQHCNIWEQIVVSTDPHWAEVWQTSIVVGVAWFCRSTDWAHSTNVGIVGVRFNDGVCKHRWWFKGHDILWYDVYACFANVSLLSLMLMLFLVLCGWCSYKYQDKRCLTLLAGLDSLYGTSFAIRGFGSRARPQNAFSLASSLLPHFRSWMVSRCL